MRKVYHVYEISHNGERVRFCGWYDSLTEAETEVESILSRFVNDEYEIVTVYVRD